MNARKLGLMLALVGVSSVGVIAGCPASVPDACVDDPACVAAQSDSGGVDGAPSCDPSKDPSCVSDGAGIFVNGAGGADSNAGTKEAPVKTIGAALTKATGSKNAVYICVGSYTEHVKLTSAVNLYGGFACADWSYAATNRPKIAPSDVGYSLDVESVSSAIAIQDLEFDAADAVKPGDSSIAVFVTSSNVTFTRAFLVAGTGIAGTNGTLTPLTFPDQAALNGNNADGGGGGPAQSVTCPGDAGTTVGGKGGDNGFPGETGSPSQADAGVGGTGVVCAGPGTGQDGASTSSISNGAGAAGSGTLDSSGWTAVAGAVGGVGGPGQGGGGGAGFTGFGGGGGGSGACGGAGGSGGSGGGASIALLANASTIALSASTLSAGNAGAGGAGVAGQAGQTPGGFHGNGAGAACNGGGGGAGGSGGAGGGGAGGVSVGVLYKGPAPTIDQATQNAIIVAPSGGAKGTGGAPGTNDGIAGVAQATLEIK